MNVLHFVVFGDLNIQPPSDVVVFGSFSLGEPFIIHDKLERWNAATLFAREFRVASVLTWKQSCKPLHTFESDCSHDVRRQLDHVLLPISAINGDDCECGVANECQWRDSDHFPVWALLPLVGFGVAVNQLRLRSFKGW